MNQDSSVMKWNSGSVSALALMATLFVMTGLPGCGRTVASRNDPATSEAADSAASDAPNANSAAAENDVSAAVQQSDVVTSGGASDPVALETAAAAETKTTKEPKKIYVRPRTKIRAGGVLDLVFDDLAFDIKADGDFDRKMLTDEIESYHGKSIILRGFMLDASVFQKKGIKEFVLIRDNQECCFGPGAKICHNVWVNMDEGTSAKFNTRPMEIRGKFTIRPYIHPIDNKCYSVYHLQAVSAVMAR